VDYFWSEDGYRVWVTARVSIRGIRGIFMQKKGPAFSFGEKAGHRPGNDLLSQGLSPHYHRRNSVSLPGSDWDRVVPPCYGHQKPELSMD
jgi:hypothetical protein